MGQELKVIWQLSKFYDLTIDDLYLLLKARQEVFIVEQKIAYLDNDNNDQKSYHLLGLFRNHQNKDQQHKNQYREKELAAYLRILPPGLKYPEVSIGRVLTTPDFRRLGLGKQLIAEALHHIEEVFETTSIRISAQAYLERFYQGFGFKTVSPPYLEDNIPHVEMLRP